MAFKALVTIRHGRPKKDEEGKVFTDDQLIYPGEYLPEDMRPEEVRDLVAAEAAVDERHHDRVVKLREKRAASFAPDLVKDEEVVEGYDPREAAKDVKVEDREKTAPQRGRPSLTPENGKKASTKADDKEPKPSMSKQELMEIAEARGVAVDETRSRDEIYKQLTETK